MAGLFFLVLGVALAAQSFAITGPSAGAGVGSGLIDVEPTGTGNLSVGATAADTSTKFQITGTTANSSAFGLKVWPSSGSVNFQVRNDGVVSITSTTYIGGSICFGAIGATDCVSSWSGVGGGVTSTPAGYVTPGYFNSIAGTGGNYSFPAALSIGTSTAPSGGVLFVNGNIGIGTAAPGVKVEIFGTDNALRLTYDATHYATLAAGNSGKLTASFSGSGSTGGYLDITQAHTYYGFLIHSGASWGGQGLIGTNKDLGISTATTTQDIVFYGNNFSANEYVRIKGTGNVGIATTTPGSKLTVAGTIYSSTGGFKFPDGTTQTTAAGAGTSYWTLSGTGLYPTSTAYQVGVGTTEPHYPLEVYGTSNKLGITYSYSALAGDSTGGELYASSNGDLHINAKRATTLIENRNILLSEAGGNVGIGTSTPGSPLTVVGAIYSSTGGFKFPDGTTQTTAATGGGGTNYFTLSGTSLYPTSTAYELAVGTASVDTNYAITTAGGGIKAESTSQPAGYFNSSSGYGLIVNTGKVGVGTTTPVGMFTVATSTGAGFFTVLPNGNVGVGTANPTQKFHVIGAAYADSNMQSPTGYFNVLRPLTTGGDLRFLDSTSTERMRLASTGNLGVGTSTPSARLDVMGNILAGDRASTADGYLDFGSNGAGSARIARTGMGATDSSLVLSTTWGTLQERMRITGLGKVGIATTTPGSQLTVAGEIYSSTGGFKFPDGTTQTTAATGGSGTNYFTLSGTNLYPTSTAYKVGIATTTPGYPLTVDGTSMFTGTMTIGLTGAGKLNVGTVDPPYTINGMQYATYMSGMTGQKEETTGEVNVRCQSDSRCEYVIDFKSVERGSDLWLFAKTTNLKAQMDKLTVLLTPSFNGKVWYEKDAKNMVLKIFALPSSAGAYSVSYRLTAPRFDSANWLNTRNEPGVNGFVIND